MADTLLPIKLPPGFRNTGTVYQAKGRWHDGNFVRFFQDTIQPIGGWYPRTLSGASIVGIPRSMVSYRRNDDTQVVVIGTTRGLYAIVSSVVYDITPSEVVSNNANRVWQLDFFGAYLIAADLIAPNTAGAVYYWTGDTATTGEILSPFTGTTPLNALSVVATPERFLVVLGGLYTASGWSATGAVPKARVVTWATQEGGLSGSDWVPGAADSAGDFTLTTDGSLVCGRRTRGMTLLWTTTDLWSMSYIGGTFVYRFEQVGNQCGIIAPNAVSVNDTAAFWMGQRGFYKYDGFVNPLVCDVQDYVFDSLNRTYAHYIWSIENPTFGEVTWFYPSATATEIDRYVTYNYRENHWVTGTLSRTCGIAQQPGTAVYPVMCSSAGVVYDHETGYGRNGEGVASLESGPVELGDGDRVMHLLLMIPDDRTLGDIALMMYTAPNPDTAETEHGPYPLAAETSLRLTARQMRMKLFESVVPSNAAWVARTVDAADTYVAAAWASSLSLFVALAGDSITSNIRTSTTGVTWSDRTTTATGTHVCIAWSPELALFVSPSFSDGSFIRSSNGTAWTTDAFPDRNCTAIAWSPELAKFVAIGGDSGVYYAVTSSNGTSWAETLTSITSSGSPTGIAWSADLGLFVLTIGSNDGGLWTSANGTTWTERTSSFPTTNGELTVSITGAAWSEHFGRFYAIAAAESSTGEYTGGGSIVTSTDGVTWTDVSPDEDLNANAVVSCDDVGTVVVLCSERASPYTSGDTKAMFTTDGTTWESVDMDNVGNWFGNIVYAPALGRLVALSPDTTSSAVETYDVAGANWRIGTIRLGVQPSGRR